MTSGLTRALLAFVAITLTAPQTDGRRPPATHVFDFVTLSEASRRTDALPQEERLSVNNVPRGVDDIQRDLFAVTLVGSDRATYVIDDSVVYEVTLKYLGNKPLTLPWSADPTLINRRMRGVRMASVLLTFTDAVLGRQIIGAENTLYGAEEVPESVVVLHHGDTVRIRARSNWWLGAAHPHIPLQGWCRHLRVKAEVQILGVRGLWPLLDSDNELKIHLRHSEPPVDRDPCGPPDPSGQR